MSRIGNNPVAIPAGITVDINITLLLLKEN